MRPPSGKSPSHGSPTRWLLLRGLGREAGHWLGFDTRLAERLGVACDALDLPGTGQRRDEPAPLSIEATAAKLAPFLVEQRANERWGVLAVSLGAMVALELGRAHPDRITHLVLVNASSRLSAAYRRLRPRGLLRLGAALAASSPKTRERRVYSLVTNATTRQVEQWSERAAAIARERPIRPRVVVRQLVAAARFAPPRVTQPTLILSSLEDRLVSSDCSEALADYLEAPHRRHARAGHDLTLEAPEWVLTETSDWLARLKASAGQAPRQSPASVA